MAALNDTKFAEWKSDRVDLNRDNSIFVEKAILFR